MIMAVWNLARYLDRVAFALIWHSSPFLNVPELPFWMYSDSVVVNSINMIHAVNCHLLVI